MVRYLTIIGVCDTFAMIDPNAIYSLNQCAALTGRSYHQVVNAAERGRLVSTRGARGQYQIGGSDLIAWRDRDHNPRAFLEPIVRPLPVEATPEPMTPEELRAIRLRLGLSQSQFARRLGCAQSAVASWESGRHGPHARFHAAIRAMLAEIEDA